MNRLAAESSLKGNQKAAYRQLLKSSRFWGEFQIVFVDDVGNFSDMNRDQVLAASN